MSDQTQAMADQAAQAIQSLCHLTRGKEALKHPGDVYQVLRSVRDFVRKEWPRRGSTTSRSGIAGPPSPER